MILEEMGNDSLVFWLTKYLCSFSDLCMQNLFLKCLWRRRIYNLCRFHVLWLTGCPFMAEKFSVSSLPLIIFSILQSAQSTKNDLVVF